MRIIIEMHNIFDFTYILNLKASKKPNNLPTPKAPKLIDIL